MNALMLLVMNGILIGRESYSVQVKYFKLTLQLLIEDLMIGRKIWMGILRPLQSHRFYSHGPSIESFECCSLLRDRNPPDIFGVSPIFVRLDVIKI